MHGSLNGTAGPAFMVVKDPLLLIGVTGLAGFTVLIVTNAAIFDSDRYLIHRPAIRAWFRW